MKYLLFILLILNQSLFAQIIPNGNSFYPIQKDGKYGYINQNGDIVIPLMYEKAYYFYDGIAAIKLKGKIGFINAVNNIIIEPQFDSTSHFSEGFCAVGINGNDNLPQQWYYINEKGKLLNTEMASIGLAADFHEGRALISLQGFDELYIINKQGKTIIKQKDYFFFEDPNVFFNSGMMKVMKPDEAGNFFPYFIDTNGHIINDIDGSKYQALGNVSEGMIWFMNNTKYGFIDKSGKKIIDALYDTVFSFSEGWARVSQRMEYNSNLGRLEGGIHGYIDKKGNWVIEPRGITGNNFHEGYTKVFANGKWGFMNTDGIVVIETELDEANDFFRNLAFVKQDGHWQYIDTKGKRIWWDSDK